MIVLGIDVGTTGVKAVAVTADGQAIASAQREYRLDTPHPGWAELDPASVWRATCRVVTQVTAVLPDAPAAIGISALGEAFLPVDEKSRPLGAAIVSFDRRALGEYEHAIGIVGAARFRAVSGTRALPYFAAFKWMWWQRQRAEVFDRTRAFIGLGSWIAFKLGATPAIDPSLAIRTALYDPTSNAWDTELAEILQIGATRLPLVRPASGRCGLVSASAGASLGLRAGTPIITGGLDQACAAYELGVEGSTGMLTLGTVAVVSLTRASIDEIPDHIPAVPHVDGVHWLAIAGSPAGGSALRWFGEIVALPAGRGRGRTVDFDSLVSAAVALRTSVMFVPHLGGSRTAFDAPDANGAFVNLTHSSSREHLARAVLDGVAYEITVLLMRLREGGLAVSRLRANGGGSRSHGWMQIIADATGLPIDSSATSLSAALGAARLAATAIGVQPLPAREAGGAFRVEPRAAWRDYHHERLGQFMTTFDALRTIQASGVNKT